MFALMVSGSPLSEICHPRSVTLLDPNPNSICTVISSEGGSGNEAVYLGGQSIRCVPANKATGDRVTISGQLQSRPNGFVASVNSPISHSKEMKID